MLSIEKFNKKLISEGYKPIPQKIAIGEDVSGVSNDDLVNVIISLKSNGIVDNYNENNLGYNTLNEYATSRHATSNVKAMKRIMPYKKEDFLSKIFKNYGKTCGHEKCKNLYCIIQRTAEETVYKK